MIGSDDDEVQAEAVVSAEGMDEGNAEDAIGEEGEVPRVLRDPGMPSLAARRLHNINHLPFRSWCDHCVRGRGRDRQHRKLCGAYNGDAAEIPRVVMDYGFITATVGDDNGKEGIKCLVLKETMAGSLWAYAVKHKGVVAEPWVTRQIMHDLDTVGISNERFVAKSDQEASISAIVAELARLRKDKGTSIEESQVGDSNSNARAEVAVQEFKGMFRTLRSALDGNIGSPVAINHAIIPWLVRHAAATVTRYQVRADGRTAFQRIKGYKGIMPVCEFAEMVHFRQQKANKLPGYEDRWQDGLWLGYDLRSGENIVGTSTGVYRTGATRRKSEDHRWSRTMMDSLVGDPEIPVPGKDAGRPRHLPLQLMVRARQECRNKCTLM